MPSMQFPVTFITRPLICAPTGMVIGADVFVTSIPRCSPSVLSIATVLTVSSPICCCTSRMRLLPSFLFMTSASWILGSSLTTSSPERSKCTSTTGPITCETFPLSPGILLYRSFVFLIWLAANIENYMPIPVCISPNPTKIQKIP